MNKKICCVFNYAPHYRLSIFRKMDEQLDCDFYFGDNVFTSLKKIDYSLLKGYQSELKTKHIRSFKWQFGIKKTLNSKYNTYIITGDPSYLSNWILVIYCLIANKKVYLWCHGYKFQNTLISELFTNLFYRLANGGLLLYGTYTQKKMIKDGYQASKLFVIYNSLNYEEQLILRQKPLLNNIYQSHFENADPVVIFIGRLQTNKRLDQLLEAQMRLSEAGVYFNIILIGSGESYQHLENYCASNALSKRVWFYGPCYEESLIAPLIFNAALTVSPGSTGLTIIHSLTYGTPVITHSNFENQGPEFEAITPGVNGDFFEENNINDLSEKIYTWLDKVKKNRNEVRESCYKIIDSYYNPFYQIELLKSIIK